jgi:DNA-binding transcriptional MerR regulator
VKIFNQRRTSGTVIMFRIGIFSRISQVPVSALRYYDELGLLKAAYIDSSSGYRYYRIEQLSRLQRILALKDIGLSLEEIHRLFKDDLSLEALKGMLRLKQVELHQRLQDETERLHRLENWLKVIEQEEAMPAYEVVLKKVDAIPVVFIRDVIADYPAQSALWDELDAFLSEKRLAVEPPGVTVYHQEEPEIEVEVCIQVKEPATAAGAAKRSRIQYHELPGIDQAAATIYSGPLNAIGDGYKALVEWIERQGYRICGPTREVYLRGPQAHSQTDPGVMVELQAPITKA